MDIHKKFTFDNPEDSYWNTSVTSENSSSFFDDPQDAVATARQALEELTESRENFSGSAITAGGSTDETNSIASSDKALSEFDPSHQHQNSISKILTHSTPIRRPDVTNFNDSASSIGDFKVNETTPSRPPPFPPASIVSDGSIGSYTSESTVNLDYSRLKSEHRKLQKHLELVRSERYRSPPIYETIKRLCSCQPVSLDLYRTKNEKVELLDAAVDTLDRDVIIRVVLFLKRTLSNTNFREILIFKSTAASAYISYLRESGEHEELIDSLFSLGRNDEAAMVEFMLASKKRQPDAKIQALKKCLISGFTDPMLAAENGYVRDYINLLERQIPIDSTDDQVAKAGKDEIFVQFPKKASLIGQPLLTTLYYCCLYHYNLPINSYASPLSVKEFFNLTDKEFNWMAISALSRLKRYKDIENLMTTKKLIGPAKLTAPFAWPSFFGLIFKYGAPPKEYLHRWIRSIPELEERLKVCEMTSEAREVQIETLIALKDRQKLTALIKRMTPHTVEHNKAHIALANTAYKWKN